MLIKDTIGFDKKKGDFTLGSHNLAGKELNDVQASTVATWRRDFDELLAGLAGPGHEADKQALAAAVVEPIEKVVPYVEMYNTFYMDQALGELEDNSIPIEDVVAIAWETHQDGAARPVRSGYYWTRPSFVTYDTAMDVPWNLMRKAGWNVFARQMRRAVEALARKRDERALNTYVAALLASHVVTVSSATLSKASIDTVVRGAADIGFPVTRALVNPGTLKDMADFVWPVGLTIDGPKADALVTTQFLSNYGGVDWYVNPHLPINRVRFAGPPAQIGYHQQRGAVRNSSDTDIINKRDLYLIEDAEHAWYIANDLSLWEIRLS